MKEKLVMRKMLVLFVATFFVLGAYAQEVVLKGVVTSSEDNQPLPGVTITVKGTTNGTITDFDGNYTLTVPSDAMLVYSYIGMKPQVIGVEGRTEINVQLESDLFNVDEVVVVGYGVQKKSLVTGAIAKVDGDQLKKSSDMRVTQALQGKTAGVVISGNSGQPGDNVSVRIRGIGTNGDAEPLYIIDGLPMSGSGTDFLSSGDIESIEVLKDAASCAIYGARGANGVILITTKSGKKGEKFTVNYDGYYGFQNPWKKVNLLNAQEYVMLTNEASVNGTGSLFFTNEDVASFTANTDWQDEMFNYDAPKQNHAISFTGGSENTTYSSSLNYFDQEGIVAKGKSEYERISFRLNTLSEFGFFKLGTNINLVRVTSKELIPTAALGTD